MTDGQFFYLVACAVFAAAATLEHLWKRRKP